MELAVSSPQMSMVCSKFCQQLPGLDFTPRFTKTLPARGQVIIKNSFSYHQWFSSMKLVSFSFLKLIEFKGEYRGSWETVRFGWPENFAYIVEQQFIYMNIRMRSWNFMV